MIFLSQKPTILIGKEVIGDGHDLDFIEINNPSGQSLSLAFGPNRTGMGIRIVVSSFGIGHFMATRLPPKPFVWNRLFVGNDLVSCTIWIYFGIPATPHRRARARNPGPYGDAVGCQHPFCHHLCNRSHLDRCRSATQLVSRRHSHDCRRLFVRNRDAVGRGLRVRNLIPCCRRTILLVADPDRIYHRIGFGRMELGFLARASQLRGVFFSHLHRLGIRTGVGGPAGGLCADLSCGLLDFEKRNAPFRKPVPTTRGWKRIIRGSWPLWTAAVLLAVLNSLTLFFSGKPWGITSAFVLWGSKILQATGIDVASWSYWSGANEQALKESVLAHTTSIMDFGIIFGALFSAAISGTFKLQKSPPKWRPLL